MRTVLTAFLSLVALPAAFVLVTSTAAMAKDRPLGSGSRQCWQDPGADTGCGGALCWCCYGNGCWICNGGNPDDCHWDPSYAQAPPLTRPPYSPRPPSPGLLAPSPGGTPKGPSGLGTPRPAAPSLILR